MSNEFPEAGAVINVDYKRTDGFVIKLTLRDQTGKEVLTRLEGAIKEIVAQGGVPYERSSGFPKKEKEYVVDRKCPTCQSRLIYFDAKGKKAIKCETNRWNKALGKAEGCVYIEWPEDKATY